ncbi:replication restart helicase PriA [Nitrospira moscoviensis]|uniref:Probable replication restart protein PriA n=1 Tax=Nitrospira moscoviensis TaxID=42253 RepID=A0A0K2G6Q3_NITMO|nr:primosomal protein N' [Nitrospira moscoviensis]ALA56610.1 putative Primosomal protein N' [Nitrospira moscoviensis]
MHSGVAVPGDSSPLYADVLVPRHIHKSFTYRIPAALNRAIAVGHHVLVPFGRGTLAATVVSLSPFPPAGVDPAIIKDISSMADGAQDAKVAAVLFALSRRVADAYAAPWGQCLRLIVPRRSKAVNTRKHRGPRATAAATRAHTAQPLPDLHGRELPQPDPAWSARIAEALNQPAPARLLVHAPWLQRQALLASAIRQTHAKKKSTLIVCGEAAKAESLRHLLEAATKLPIGLLEPVGAGTATQNVTAPSILIGTRAAVFAPVPSVGLIWIEGEEDPALKEPQEPRYHAREVASMRAELEGALVVFASAHPSMEAYRDPDADDCLFHRSAAARAAINVVDLRREPAGLLLSDPLVRAMEAALAVEAGVLLFLNRKGYAGALACRDCGWVPRCGSCAVALTYYRESAKLACRYCGERCGLPDVCPTCGAARLNPVGEGTERVELEARRLFPRARIARLDGDTLRGPSQARRLWAQVYGREVDIVVGTQAVFQRGPLPAMGLVGIVQADVGLHVPDFRAAERTYQLLEEAVAAARPAADGGKVVLQTLLPTHHAIEAVTFGEPRRFYGEELAARRLLGYPPAVHLAGLSVSGKSSDSVDEAARRWRIKLGETTGAEDTLTILGPVPALGGRPRGHHRRHMLVKGPDRTALCNIISRSVEELEREYPKRQAKFVVDIDPVEMS